MNRDPASPASEPALDGFVTYRWETSILAWVEGGQVVARVEEQAGTFGPPVVLNADPAASARSPQLAYGWLVFVERGPSGDRFEIRRWDGAAWQALPSLETGGDVTSFTVSGYGRAILWRDPAGNYFLRSYNE